MEEWQIKGNRKERSNTGRAENMNKWVDKERGRKDRRREGEGI